MAHDNSWPHVELILAIGQVSASVQYHEANLDLSYDDIIGQVREQPDRFLADPRYAMTKKYFQTVCDAPADTLAVALRAKTGRDEDS